MTDREVGELWRNFRGDPTIRKLISKLVEERSKQYDWDTSNGIPEALRDFGIPESEWK
jgi:hypothetical protein